MSRQWGSNEEWWAAKDGRAWAGEGSSRPGGERGMPWLMRGRVEGGREC